MKTKTISVYSFDELSDKAKEKAINNYRSNGIDTGYIYDDAHKTVKEFHEIFGTSEGCNSWLDVSCDNIDNNVLELKGLRLRTYIINNYWQYLFKGKYYSLWSKTEKSFKHYKDGYPVLKTRYSKVTFGNCCVLTGVCYDDSLLYPIYDFLKYKDKPDYYSYMDFETLMNDCFEALERDVKDEENSQYEDEQIIDAIEANEYEFDEDGNML